MTNAIASRPVTVSHAFGEIVWLVSQSPLHGTVRAAELPWLLLPPIIHRQFHIFRDADRPVGAAIWAKTDATGDSKLAGGILNPGNQLDENDWVSGEQIWLVDLIAPFATRENQQREVMFGDLVTGRLSGLAFKMQRIDLNSGCLEVVEFPASVGKSLAEHLRAHKI